MNKKIQGATQVSYHNIRFKSKLERACYIKFKEAGFNPIYEPSRFIIWEGGKIEGIKAFQTSKTNRKEVELITRALLPITYTPDFLIKVSDNLSCYFDAKGYPNDRWALKKKMFIQYLQEAHKDTGHNFCFFEIRTLSQLNNAIKIIKEMRPLEKINSLLPSLAPKDAALAQEFVKKRDFRSLWELVHSAIIKINRAISKGVLTEEQVDLESLQLLEAEVSNYQTIIDPDWFSDREPEESQDEEY